MNIFQLPEGILEEESFETLIPDNGVLIERIVSTGQVSPPGFWYEQERDEWVVLLQGQARLAWENGRSLDMNPGDWVLITARERHRVEYTSQEPACIWLAVHGQLR